MNYTYGSGMTGCLYDNGPHEADSIDAAIDDLLNLFGDTISHSEQYDLQKNLKDNNIHYFKNAQQAGAEYCEIVQCID